MYTGVNNIVVPTMALFPHLNTETDSQFTPSHIPTLDELIAIDAASSPLVNSSPSVLSTLSSEQSDQNWQNLTQEEGQLAIDVYETDDTIIVVSAIAGVKSQDLELTLQQDMLTVRGTRTAPEDVGEGDPLISECYWGGFSRTIILPSSIDPQQTTARLSSGVLVIRLHKIANGGSIPVVELEEEEE